MNAARLAEIEALANAATPGPWEGSTLESVGGGSVYSAAGWMVASANIYPAGVANGDHALPAFPAEHVDTTANAAFIAEARTAVPDLVTALREARELAEAVERFVRRYAETRDSALLGDREDAEAWLVDLDLAKGTW